MTFATIYHLYENENSRFATDLVNKICLKYMYDRSILNQSRIAIEIFLYDFNCFDVLSNLIDS